jgi:acetyl esterase/lipase
MCHTGWSRRSGVLLGLVVVAPAAGQITPAFNDVNVGVVPTDAGGTITLRMDIYRPAATPGALPVVAWIHGGGWQNGSYNNGLPAAARPLLDRGIAVATIGYRLSGTSIFPAQIHDVKGAIRFLRANAATFGLRPERIGAWGTSAGGHLTALLATSGGVADAEGTTGGNLDGNSRIMAAVDYFGPTDLLNMSLDYDPPQPGGPHDQPTSAESRLIGFDGAGEGIGVLRANQTNPAAPFPEKMRLVTLANPITHLDRADPAFFIAHGTNDNTVPIGQSTRLANALNALAVPNTYFQVVGAGHGGLGTLTDTAARDFLANHLLAIDGDADLDGDVDVADFASLAANFNRPGAWRHGDFDNRGVVDLADFARLAANFNVTSPRASLAAVPEPGASGMGALSLAGLAGARRVRRRAYDRPIHASVSRLACAV